VALPRQEVVDVIPPGRLAYLGIAIAVPVLQVQWFDERQTCRQVHDYLQGRMEGVVGDYSCCHAYAAGVCRATGGAELLCMFHEPEAADGGRRARQWERVTLADGTRALQRRQRAYSEPLDLDA
jgi:hypothetical protein